MTEKPKYCECTHAEFAHRGDHRGETSCDLCQKCWKYRERG